MRASFASLCPPPKPEWNVIGGATSTYTMGTLELVEFGKVGIYLPVFAVFNKGPQKRFVLCEW